MKNILKKTLEKVRKIFSNESINELDCFSIKFQKNGKIKISGLVIEFEEKLNTFCKKCNSCESIDIEKNYVDAFINEELALSIIPDKKEIWITVLDSPAGEGKKLGKKENLMHNFFQQFNNINGISVNFKKYEYDPTGIIQIFEIETLGCAIFEVQ